MTCGKCGGPAVWAIVAALSVVTKDGPPDAVVGGNPARVVRQRSHDGVVAEWRAIRKWDWPVDKISRNLHAIVGPTSPPCEALLDAVLGVGRCTPA